MADISKVKIPSVSTPYNIKDANAGYSVAIDSNNNTLQLKNADGTVISYVTLPSSDSSYTVQEEKLGAFNYSGNTLAVKTSDGKLVANMPYVENIVNSENGNIFAKIIRYNNDTPTLTFTKLYACQTNKTVSAYDVVTVLSNGSAQSSTISNYISDKPVEYGAATNPKLCYGNIYDYSLNSSSPLGTFDKSFWTASNNSAVFASGYATAAQDSRFLMQAYYNGGTFGANTILTGTQAINGLYDKNILQNILFYNSKDVVLIASQAGITWDGSYSTAFMRGIMNAKQAAFSVLDTSGNVLRTSGRQSVNGGGTILRATSCASGEINVIKVNLYVQNDVHSAGDLHFYMQMPTGKTALV